VTRIEHRRTIATQVVCRLQRFLYVFTMSPIPERTIYPIEEAALHIKQRPDYLLNEGALGKLQLFVFVPEDIQVMNVGMFDERDRASPDPVMRMLNNRVDDQKPLRTFGIAVLMLSPSDCQRILAMGTYAQAAFSSAGKLDEKSMVQKVKPEQPPKKEYAVSLPFPRHFATYIKQVAFERWGEEASPERKSISLTIDKLFVSAEALSGYIKVPVPAAPVPTALEKIHNALFEAPSEEKKTRKRSLSEVSRLIKKAYLSLDAKDRDENQLVWDALIKMAKSKSPPLRRVVSGEIEYENSSGGDGRLTYKAFLGRLATIRSNEEEE